MGEWTIIEGGQGHRAVADRQGGRGVGARLPDHQLPLRLVASGLVHQAPGLAGRMDLAAVSCRQGGGEDELALGLVRCEILHCHRQVQDT